VRGFLLKNVCINLEQYGNVRHSMQPDEDLNRSKQVVAIGLSRVVSLLLVLIWIYSDLCLCHSYIIHTVY